jgi:hypothetical protein
MTESEKVQAVARGEVSVEQMRKGVLEGPDSVRQVCWKALAHHGLTNVDPRSALEEHKSKAARQTTPKRPSKNDKRNKFQAKQRFGLPKGFVPRPQREQTNILLANNVYRMPDGTEVVPCHPTGILGRLHHLYALLTPEQVRKGGKGSRYVRTDGRIFDYSVDDVDSGREMFDTGLTVRDLERTGGYVIGAEIKMRAGKKRPTHIKYGEALDEYQRH